MKSHGFLLSGSFSILKLMVTILYLINILHSQPQDCTCIFLRVSSLSLDPNTFSSRNTALSGNKKLFASRRKFFQKSFEIVTPSFLIWTTTTTSATAVNVITDPVEKNPVRRRNSKLDRSYMQCSRSVRHIRQMIDNEVKKDPTIAGAFVRLAFHDAAAGGPNGSIQWPEELLQRSENRGLSKPLYIVQSLREEYDNDQSLQNLLSLSLADWIALAGAQAVQSIGGPHIPITLGRIDSHLADPEYLPQPISLYDEEESSRSRSLVKKTLPEASLDSDGLRAYFGKLHSMTEPEFVALVGGAHGLGRHVSLLNMSKECLKNLTRTCLEDAPTMLPFVTANVNRFDNTYFQALLKWNENQVQMGEVAFIPTDVAMVVDEELQTHVRRMARDRKYFERQYVLAYQKLVENYTTKNSDGASDIVASLRERF